MRPDLQSRPIRETPLARALIPQGYSSLNLKRDKRTDQLYVECLANGKAVCLLLDTGATHSALSIDLARQFKLKLKKIKGQVTGVGGSQEFTTARIDEFKVDGLPSIYLEVAVLDFSAAVTRAKQDGNIVMDGVLARVGSTRTRACWIIQMTFSIVAIQMRLTNRSFRGVGARSRQ